MAKSYFRWGVMVVANGSEIFDRLQTIYEFQKAKYPEMFSALKEHKQMGF